jgi:hypothetical protein
VGGGTATGRGMAFVKYENNRIYVGMVATVEIVRATGIITAKHFAVVQDCGQVINPDGVKNRIEGNVVQTVSRTLIEQVHFDRPNHAQRPVSFYRREFLDSPAPVCLSHINIPFGINRHGMGMGKRTGLMPRTPEA